jgi:hypothetical protein
MSLSNESRMKMQEADALVQKVVNLANPSHPQIVQATKVQQTKQIKVAIANVCSGVVVCKWRDVVWCVLGRWCDVVRCCTVV